MGLFAAAQSAKHTIWMGAAIFGYYFLASDVVVRALHADPGPVRLIFLLALVLYGLWTRSPMVPLMLTGAIAFLWAIAGLGRPGLLPDVDAARPMVTFYALATPVVAVGIGAALRALLFRKRQPKPEPGTP